MKLGSAELGVCSSCNCEHYYQTDTCENAMKRKKATRIDMHNWGNPDNPAVVYSYQEHIRSLESRVKDIESAWQDAELRADTNLKRVEELEATLKTLAAQAMYAAGYTKKGDWRNETL
jgi:predicted amidophosphoribosyltransferase